MEDKPERLADARDLMAARHWTSSLDSRAQNRPGCVRQGAGADVLQDRCATSSRPPIPTIFTSAAGSPGGTEEAVAAAAELCDVVSFNIYDRRVDSGKWGFLQDVGRPVIIGEFHAGALDRGMFHTGLVAAADQNERAAIYTRYVESVLKNPSLVGCHWFQYVDEPLTGRAYDGENYNIGFLSVTDTPYPELVAAARAIHRRAYQERSTSP